MDTCTGLKKMNLPKNVDKVLSLLNDCGFEAYLVGGCVRDTMMNKQPNDYDITTNALPEEIIACFHGYKTVLSGIKHGTVGIVSDGELTEVTTYRLDGDYIDGRHPENVTFTSDIKSDLARRDFTVNAIALARNGEIVDPFGGTEDIKNKIIRCVGEADIRFGEDALRIMRGVRFLSVLGFEAEEKTAFSMKKNTHLLSAVSAERIFDELKKLIMGENVCKSLLEYKEIICRIIPEFFDCVDFDQHNIHHCYDVYTHTAHTVGNCPYDITLRLAALFHDIGKPSKFFVGDDGQGHFYGHAKESAQMTEKILTKLKASAKEKNEVAELVAIHDRDIADTAPSLKRLLSKYSEETAEKLFDLKIADTLSQSEICFSRINSLKKTRMHMKEIAEKKECFNISSLAINGGDLIALGVPQSKKIGEILKILLESVINGEIKNERVELTRKLFIDRLL